MGAARPLAVPVNHEGVLADRKAEPLGYGVLAILDTGVHEFFDVPAVKTQDVIMMGARVQFEHRHTVGKVVTRHEPGGLELGQHAVHRRKADLFTQINQASVDVFRRQVPVRAVFKNFEDLDARKRHLESCLAQIAAFHDDTRSFG
jgi:hypothetical protein